jgi:hypothetical protein
MSLSSVRGAVRADRQLGVADLLGEPGDVGDDVRSRAGQTDVGGVDAEPVHQVEDADLVRDRRAPDRRRLESVTEGLVVEADPERRLLPALAGLVPIVDEIAFVHVRV